MSVGLNYIATHGIVFARQEHGDPISKRQTPSLCVGRQLAFITSNCFFEMGKPVVPE